MWWFIFFLFPVESLAQSLTTVDRMHSSLSTIVRRATNLVDQLFHDESDKDLDAQNRSRLYISNRTSLNNEGEIENRFRFKSKIRLRKLPKKFLLTITANEEDENQQEGQPTILNADALNDNRERATEGSISFIQQLGNIARVKFSSGIRISTDPTPRLKMRVFNDFKAGEVNLSPNIEGVWNSDTGFGQKASFNISGKFTPYIFATWVNEQFWFDENDILETSFGPSLGHELSDRRSISYNFRIQYLNRPRYQLNNYNLSAQYRQNLHRGWFFYEIGPFVNFRRDQGFKRSEGMSLNLILALGGPTI